MSLTTASLVPYSTPISALDLTPLTAFSDIACGVSPRYYTLRHDDFHTFGLDNGKVYYCLDQGMRIALWWSLKHPKATIQAFWMDFQDIGKRAVEWIEVARYRSSLLGEESNWDWNTAPQSQLDLLSPSHY